MHTAPSPCIELIGILNNVKIAIHETELREYLQSRYCILPLAKQLNFRVAAAASPPTTQIYISPANKSTQYEYHLAIIVEITENRVIEVSGRKDMGWYGL